MGLKGMTGFARCDGSLGDWSWTVEARSVNGRTLEVRFRASVGLEALERGAREAAQARFQRGQIGLSVAARRADTSGGTRVHPEVMERYLEAIAPLVQAGRASPPTADGLLALRGVIETAEADDKSREALEAAISQDIVRTLADLDKARAEEGRSLETLVGGFLERLEILAAEAGAAAATQPNLIRDRFARRLADLVGEAAPADRILQEAAVQAVRADVREELDRLTAHVGAARELLRTDGPVGRRLDFLAQEFMREANTLTSKSASSDLTAVGLELKAVIDQLREQVQNVE